MSAEFKKIAGGLCIKELTPDSHGNPRCVHVMRMLFNYRIVRSIGVCDSPWSTYDRGWSYRGTDFYSLAKTVVEAMAWGGEDDTCPIRWNKNVLTGQRIDPPGYLPEGEEWLLPS